MFTRQLGKSGISVSAMGLGCWAIGGDRWGQVNDQESIRAIHRALDLGITFFDTADVYGAGHSEQVLGQALHGKRNQVIIASKFGNSTDPKTSEPLNAQNAESFIANACETSLKRLNTDYLDLYQFHVGNFPVSEADTIEAGLEALVSAGKIRYYGWSTDSPEQAQVFLGNEPYIAVQQRLNLFEGNPDTLTVCEQHNLASINRGPLAMGLLTGKFTTESQLPKHDIRGVGMPWVKSFVDGKPNAAWLIQLEAVRDILTSEGRSLTQGALAWLWGRSQNTIPIPGFKSVAQVEENAAAMRFGPLSKAQMAEVDRLLT